VTYFEESNPKLADANLHPFLFHGTRIAMAHNGTLFGFEQMKFHLLPYIKDCYSEQISGTTDSEWIYALLLSQIKTPDPDLHQIIEALEQSLGIIRRLREQHDIKVSSGVNLFLSDGIHLLATRFAFDFGRYVTPVAPTLFNFQSLWFTMGTDYGLHAGEWRMASGERRVDSLLIASEPLTRDTTTWIEVPEYTLVAATKSEDGIKIGFKDLDH
ncbi:MAG: class II glutamine amidotransferase, partial [Gammaproteobacteria bacterium]